MPMSIVFDTLAYAKKLKEAGFSEQQAEVLAESQAEIIEGNLATKQDLKELEAHIKAHLIEKLSEHKTDILKWVASLLFVQTGILIGAFFAVARLLK